MTSNHTLEKETFEHYMKWMEPMIDDIKISKFSGHQAERSISIFYLINNLKHQIIPNILNHYQLDSHGNQGTNGISQTKNYEKLLNHE
jgi:hypothetical protein